MASIVQPLNTTIVNFSSFVGVPVLSDADGNGIPTPRNIPVMLCTITLYLDVLKQQNRMNRRIADDQLFIYQYVESRLTNEYGVDGRSCLLRFICEINRFPIREWTIIGELISEMFTPREGEEGHLEAYHYAAETGRSAVGLSPCSHEYSNSCPMSVFNFFNQQEVF